MVPSDFGSLPEGPPKFRETIASALLFATRASLARCSSGTPIRLTATFPAQEGPCGAKQPSGAVGADSNEPSL